MRDAGSLEVTYRDRARPKLRQHRLWCHRPSEAAPWSSTSRSRFAGIHKASAGIAKADRSPPLWRILTADDINYHAILG